MFLLGILSFFQIVFIPGYLLVTYIFPSKNLFNDFNRTSKLFRIVLIFAFSLLINYLLVFTFTAAHIYTFITLYVLIVLEVLVWIYFRFVSSSREKIPRSTSININIPGWISESKAFFDSCSTLYKILFLGAIIIILWYAFIFFYFLGDVFEHWDPVVGWNRFAVEWASNHFPTHTFRYPQLIPSNWSLTYVIMQNSGVQCFAKAIMPLFPLAIISLFLSAALQKKNASYLLSLIIYSVLTSYFYDPSYIASGYVDIAISFFAFLAFFILLNVSKNNHTKHTSFLSRFQYEILAVVFASAAAVTKQSGLFFLSLVIITVIFRLIKNRKSISLKNITLLIISLILIVLIITASWYIMKEIDIRGGNDISEVGVVQKVHQSPHLTERLLSGIQLLATVRHPKLQYFFFLGMLIVFLGLFNKKSRNMTLFISIPYFFIWGFLFSYDIRNLAPAVPFFALSGAYGLKTCKNFISTLTSKLPAFKFPVWVLYLLILITAVIANFTIFDSQTIIRQQNQLKMEIGDAQLNELLYKYHDKIGFTGKIATNYQYLRFLPNLEPYYLYKAGRISYDFLQYLDTPQGQEIHYLLIPKIIKSETAVYSYIRGKIQNGEYRFIFKHRGYEFYFVRARQSVNTPTGN